MKKRIIYAHSLCLFIAALLLISGCKTIPTDKDVYSEKVIAGFFSSPQDPRRFSLTVYQSKHGPVFSGTSRLHQGQHTDLEFISPKNTSFPVIETRGRTAIPVPTLIDTTSRDNWLNLTAATALGAQPLGPPPYRRYPDHTSETDPGFASFISKLKIGEIHVENAIFYTRIPQITLGPLKRDVSDPTPDAVIGCRLLRQFAYVRFDYPERKLFISSTAPYTGDPSLLLSEVPYRTENGALAVDAWLDDEKTTLLIDTSGDFELAWNTGGSHNVNKLFIGDLCIQDVAVTDSAAMPIGQTKLPRIGIRLLRRFAVIMDNKQRTLRFERPQKFLKSRSKPSTKENSLQDHREVDQIIMY